MEKLYKEGSEKPKSGIIKGLRKTLDGRECQSGCSENAKPGQKGAATPPEDSLLGQPEKDEEGGGQDGESGVNEGMPEKDLEDEEAKPSEDEEESDQISENEKNSLTAEVLSCGNKATEKLFEGATGQTFRINCPKGCKKGVVIDTMIYEENSQVCQAAIHAGLVDPALGGDVIIEIANGQNYYQGSV